MELLTVRVSSSRQPKSKSSDDRERSESQLKNYY